jgi:hypothetical protein
MADAGVEHPAADTLDRSMVRLDVAVMNAERLKYVEEGPYYRYPRMTALRSTAWKSSIAWRTIFARLMCTA